MDESFHAMCHSVSVKLLGIPNSLAIVLFRNFVLARMISALLVIQRNYAVCITCDALSWISPSLRQSH